MAKKSRKSTPDQANDSANLAEATLATLLHDVDLGYRIRVLLHDLSNIGSDLNAQKRLSSTTHELYISGPYFTECEAIKIRTTLVDNITNAIITEEQTARSVNDLSSSFHQKTTLEEAIHSRLANFFEKRRASGDSRPCGSHDMAPVYASVFGIDSEELKDESFLSRLRRSGLGDKKSQ